MTWHHHTLFLFFALKGASFSFVGVTKTDDKQRGPKTPVDRLTGTLSTKHQNPKSKMEWIPFKKKQPLSFPFLAPWISPKELFFAHTKNT